MLHAMDDQTAEITKNKGYHFDAVFFLHWPVTELLSHLIMSI